MQPLLQVTVLLKVERNSLGVLTNCADGAGELCERCHGSGEQLWTFSLLAWAPSEVDDAVCFPVEQGDLLLA